MASVPLRERFSSIEKIMEIADFNTAYKIMKQYGIETSGAKSKEQCLPRIAERWLAEAEGPTQQHQIPKPPPPDDGLKKALETHRKNRKSLAQKYDDLLRYYKALPSNYRRDIDHVFEDVPNKIKVKKRELEVGECSILIAGETASGKSSFINLLLGEKLLPTSQIKCTSTVCEVRSSRDGRRYYRLHYKQEGGPRPGPIEKEIKSTSDVEKLNDSIVEVDDEEESPYEKIEIYWPFPVLDDGMVIIDTPGIGGSSSITLESMQKYLESSFGVVYVLNSSSAGGVQKGRLQDLLRQIVTSTEEDFNPECTMFICNKWDSVPEGNREEVRINTCTKLRRYFPSLNEEQLYCMSIEKSFQGICMGTIIAEHQRVLEGFQTLLPASLQNQLNAHYRWISQVLKRSIYSLKVAKLMDAREMKEKEEMKINIQRQMEMLERNAKYSIENLKKGVQIEVINLHHDISKVLQSEEVKARLCRWERSEYPKPDNWKKVVKEASEIIAYRIAIEVNQWDKNNQVVKGLKEKIVKKFRKDFELMEDQMKDIEGILLKGETRIVRDLHKSMKRQAPVTDIFKNKKKEQRGKEGNTTTSLGGAVASAGDLDVKNRANKKMFKDYKKKSENVMEKATEEFLKNIRTGVKLEAKINTFLGKYVKGLDDVAKMIPQFIDADRKLMNSLSSQLSESQGNLRELYPGLIRDCSIMQGELDMFYVSQIMKPDYRLRDLKWNKQDRLGSGSFADVYKARLRKEHMADLPVAIKVCREPISNRNISEILLEDRTMRELDHENIVKYYGTTLSKQNSPTSSAVKVTWIMILEFCDFTLKDKFMNSEFSNPAKAKTNLKQIQSMKTMAYFAHQISSGLDYLHSKGLVHRDLKLENILVTSDDKVKLADVGLTKHVKEISGTMAGSPVYMAPEVLKAEDIYDSKVDIYSLGIILWEMWYGMDAAEHIGPQIYGTILQSVEGGLRPSFSLQERPPDDWCSVVKACWENNKNNRPDANTVSQFFLSAQRN